MKLLSQKEIELIPIVFIVGKGRSGTTLLQNILDAHSQTSFPPEAPFVISLYKRYYHVKDWTRSLIDVFKSDLMDIPKIKHFWRFDEALFDSYVDNLERVSFAILCKIAYLSNKSLYSKGDKVKVIGDKNPVNTLFLPWISQVFPGARYIHLVRDPRANTYSHLRFRHKSIEYISQKWQLYNDLVEIQKKIKAGSFLVMKYEDLVTLLEPTVRKVCAFIGLEFEDNMINFHRTIEDQYQSAKREGDTGKSLAVLAFEKNHSNLANPVSKEYYKLWTQHLSSQDISKVERYTSRGMQIYHYRPLSTKRIGCNPFLRLDFIIRINIVKVYYRIPLRIRRLRNEYVVAKLFKNFND